MKTLRSQYRCFEDLPSVATDDISAKPRGTARKVVEYSRDVTQMPRSTRKGTGYSVIKGSGLLRAAILFCIFITAGVSTTMAQVQEVDESGRVLRQAPRRTLIARLDQTFLDRQTGLRDFSMAQLTSSDAVAIYKLWSRIKEAGRQSFTMERPQGAKMSCSIFVTELTQLNLKKEPTAPSQRNWKATAYAVFRLRLAGAERLNLAVGGDASANNEERSYSSVTEELIEMHLDYDAATSSLLVSLEYPFTGIPVLEERFQDYRMRAWRTVKLKGSSKSVGYSETVDANLTKYGLTASVKTSTNKSVEKTSTAVDGMMARTLTDLAVNVNDRPAGKETEIRLSFDWTSNSEVTLKETIVDVSTASCSSGKSSTYELTLDDKQGASQSFEYKSDAQCAGSSKQLPGNVSFRATPGRLGYGLKSYISFVIDYGTRSCQLELGNSDMQGWLITATNVAVLDNKGDQSRIRIPLSVKF